MQAVKARGAVIHPPFLHTAINVRVFSRGRGYPPFAAWHT